MACLPADQVTVEEDSQRSPPLSKITSSILDGVRYSSKSIVGRPGAGPFVFVGFVLLFYLAILADVFDLNLVEDKKNSYTDSARLNLGIFGISILWFAVGPIHLCSVACSFVRAKLCTVFSSIDPQPLIATEEPEMKKLSLAARHYLMYLQGCAFMFFFLAVIQMLFSLVLPTNCLYMIDAFLAYDPNEVRSRTVWQKKAQLVLWLLNGIIPLFFIQVIRVAIQDDRIDDRDEDRSRVARTIWVTEMPRKDVTGEKFTLNNDHAKEVRTAIVRSIDDHFGYRTSAKKVATKQRTRLVWSDADIMDAERHLINLGYEVVKPKEEKNSDNYSSVVEECVIVPQADHWQRDRHHLDWKEEWVKYWTQRRKDAELAVQSLESVEEPCRGTRFRLWYSRMRHGYIEWKLKRANQNATRAKAALERYRDRKYLSGSAFVTFKQQGDCNTMLSNYPKCSTLRCMWHTFFTFGRPPFGSVTLRCQQAPEPDDILWKNLHVSFTYRVVLSCVLYLLLLATYIAFFMPLILMMFSGAFDVVLHKQAEDHKLHAKILHFFDHWPALQESLKIALDWRHLVSWTSKHGSTIVLLLLNSLFLPVLVGKVEEYKRCALRSTEEVNKMTSMTELLCFCVLIMPFSSMKLLQTLVEMDWFPKDGIWSDVKKAAGDLHSATSHFGMEYMMNCTFIASALQLLTVKKLCSNAIRSCFTKTDKGQNGLWKPTPFKWGNNYAFTMSIFALALILGMFTPSMFPMAAVFFWLKFVVDKYLFTSNAFDTSFANDMPLIMGAIRSTRMIVGWAWFFAGLVMSFTFVNDHMFEWINFKIEFEQFRTKGIVFVVLGIVVWIVAHMRYSQFYFAVQRSMKLSDLKSDMSCITLCLGDPQRMKERIRYVAESLGFIMLDTFDDEDVTARSWDCIRLLDLEVESGSGVPSPSATLSSVAPEGESGGSVLPPTVQRAGTHPSFA